MYINLALGAVALVVIWLFLRKLLVREDSLSESPVELLEKELARRKFREDEADRAVLRLRETARERMRPVVRALEEIQASAASGKLREALFWEDEGGSVAIHMRAKEDEKEDATLFVAWHVPELDLRKAANAGDSLAGVYVLRRPDLGTEEESDGLEACVRYITSFIVDFVA